MRGGARRRVAPVAVLAALAGILVVLAVLQYRWITQVSDADRERIQAGLENSVRQFRQEFNRELLNLCLASEPRPGQAAPEDWSRVAERLENWLQVSPFPGLVSQVYLWETARAGQPAQTLRLNRNTRGFEPAPLPAALSDLRERIEDRQGSRRRARFGEGRVFVWSVADGKPLIVHPMFVFLRRGEERPPSPQLSGYLLIELDRAFLGDVFLPELARRYFGGPEGFDYQVAVLDEGTAAEPVYRSSADLGAASFQAADVRTNLLWEPRDYLNAMDRDRDALQGRDQPPPPGRGPRQGRPFEKGPPAGALRGPRSGVLLFALDEPGWQLVVKHRQGSLESAVASLRRRNLAISFGILVLLAVSVGMIFISAQRARRLADLQMDFVAGVSHELRTPLAVIRSAADNLADGVVASGPQVHEYGKLIGREGRRLSTMIEQTLQFAGAQTGAKTYDLGSVSVESVVERTLKDLKPAVEEAGFQVETSMEPGLPLVRSNEEALSRVLANLVQNALKYGGEAKWLAVRAAASPMNGKREVELHVEDHGPGIDADDLPHVFEPFYRGKLALSNQIQGSGLGLNLAQRISRAVGARLTVESRPGRGSAFAVHLPIAHEDSGGSGSSS
jgi:signal transduction histidine kinase